MSFIYRDRKDDEFSYGNNPDFGQIRNVKKIEGYSMCVIYKDTGAYQKEHFSKKSLALDWFESFRQVNKRPVTVIFYCGITPYWVYYGNCKDKDDFGAW